MGFVDLKGLHFGRLEVLHQSESENNRKYRHVVWVCQCECGKRIEVTSHGLIQGRTKSCGCLRVDMGKKKGVNNILRGKKIELYDFNGEMLSIPQISKRTGISRSTLYYWRDNGKDMMEEIRNRKKARMNEQ